MPLVLLDAGHGGKANGEVHGNWMEKNNNLKLVLAVGEILTQYGIGVAYTRTSDATMSWLDRITIANEVEVKLFVSIYHDSNMDSGICDGTETLIFDRCGLARETAQNINRYLTIYGFSTCGIIEMQSQSAMFCKLNMPLLILLLGHILVEESNQEMDIRFGELTWAIAAGILETFQNQLNVEEKMNSVYDKKGVKPMTDRNNTEYYEDRNDEVNHRNNMDNCNRKDDMSEQNDRMEPEQEELDYRYRIQVGLFRSYENALQYQGQLFQDGFQADIVSQGDLYALHVGKFNDLDEAAVWERVLRMGGYNTLLISTQ